MSRQRVNATPPRPPRFGLLASAPPLDDGERWQDGFEFQPEACAGGGRESIELCGSTDPITPGYGPAIVEGDALYVWGADRCSTFDRTRDYEGRARRQLEATQSFQVAAELWGGSLGLAGRSLTDLASDTVTPAIPPDPIDSLACVEAGLATCGEGKQGMVHMTPQMLTVLAAARAVTLSGTTWITANGHIVVPDAGYDGTGPGAIAAGATQWIYGTSMIWVRLGPVELIPRSLTDARELGSVMSVDLNDITVRAQRLAAWQWDECCHIAAEVDLPVCLIGGTS